jgi:hypothetical protein
MLLARSAPAEPAPHSFASSNDTGEYSAPSALFDFSIVDLADSAFRIQLAGNETGTRRLTMEALNGSAFTIVEYRDGTRYDTGNSNVRYNGGTWPRDVLVRKTAAGIRIFIDDMETPRLNLRFGVDITDYGGVIRARNTFGSAAFFASAEVKPTSLVTDRIVLSGTKLEDSGVISTGIDYYIDTADYLTAELQSPSGEVLIPAAPYRIVSNEVAGFATMVTPWTVPDIRKGTRVRLVTRQAGDPAKIDTVELTVPGKVAEFGTNIMGISGAGRPRRVHSNMMVQGTWLDMEGAGFVGKNRPGYTDADGYPLKKNMTFFYPFPDEQKQRITLELKYTQGSMTIVHGDMGGSGCIYNSPTIRKTGERSWEWEVEVDRSVATIAERAGRFLITALDPADPPKGITLGRKGVEDFSQWFLPEFIAEAAKIPGRARFMDCIGTNGPVYLEGTTIDWTKREKQTGICHNWCWEDFLEFCNRTGRGMTLNVNAAWLYENGGLDYYNRVLDMVYNGTDAYFHTPGYTAANGVEHTIGVEVGNEPGNGGFGGKGHYHYYIHVAQRLRRDKNGEGPTVLNERCIAQIAAMKILQARIPDWRARTKRVLGTMIASTDYQNMRLETEWLKEDGAANYVDVVAVAPYIPNDPASGGQAANVPDKSPAGIYTYMKRVVETNIDPLLDFHVGLAVRDGYGHEIYEVNESIPSLGLTLAENLAWQKSPLRYQLWSETIIPVLTKHGGDISLYGDVSNLYSSNTQQWGFESIPNSDYNQSWDAVVDWSAAHRN